MENKIFVIEHDGAVLNDSPERCSVGAGWSWLVEGFRLFRVNSGLWVLLFLISVGINIACSLVPFINQILSVLVGAFMSAGMALVAHRCYIEQHAEIDDLFSGFYNRLKPLVQLGLMYLAGMFLAGFLTALIVAVVFGSETLNLALEIIQQQQENAKVDPDPQLLSAISFGLLIFLALIIPLLMAYIFAPILIMLHDIDPVAAMKLSFTACWRNMLPYLWYSLLLVVFLLLSVLTLFLGLLVLVPVIWASTYIAYRDIFLNGAEPQTLAA